VCEIGWRHEELYQKYKSKNNNLVWCKQCGGIAMTETIVQQGPMGAYNANHHRHVAYVNLENALTAPIQAGPHPPNDNYYADSVGITDMICRSVGGKGFPEKYNRTFIYYNELCKIKQGLAQGKKFKRKETIYHIVETIWRESQNNTLFPNINEIFKPMFAHLGKLRREAFLDNKAIVATTHFSSEEKSQKTRSREVQLNEKIVEDSNVVDDIFEEFNIKFICDLQAPDAPSPQSNVADSQSNVVDEAYI
jgi:hypothetical protein